MRFVLASLLVVVLAFVALSAAANPNEKLPDDTTYLDKETGNIVPPIPKRLSLEPISTWNEEEVSAWLHNMGLYELIGAFEQNAIDGSVLVDLKYDDLSFITGPNAEMLKKKLGIERDYLIDFDRKYQEKKLATIREAEEKAEAEEAARKVAAGEAPKEQKEEPKLDPKGKTSIEDADAYAKRKDYKRVQWSSDEHCITMTGFHLFKPDMVNALNVNQRSWRDEIHAVHRDAALAAEKEGAKPRPKPEELSGCQRLFEYIYPEGTLWHSGKVIVVIGTDYVGIGQYLSEKYKQSYILVFDDGLGNIPEKELEMYKKKPHTRRIKETVWQIPVSGKMGLCVLFHMGIRPDVVFYVSNSVEKEFLTPIHADQFTKEEKKKLPVKVECGCDDAIRLWKRVPLIMGDTPNGAVEDLSVLDRTMKDLDQRMFVDEPCWMLTNQFYGISCPNGNSYSLQGGFEQPLVAANIVVKDVADTIVATLDSVLPHVDRINVLDYGSTDDTIKIAREHIEAFKQLHEGDSKRAPLLGSVKTIQFEGDMSAVRNHGLKLVSNSTQWVLEMNGNEELLEGASMRRFLEQRRAFCGPSTDVIEVTVQYTAAKAPTKSIRLTRTQNHMHDLERGMPWPMSNAPANASFWAYQGLTQEVYMNQFAQNVLKVQFEGTGSYFGFQAPSLKRFGILGSVRSTQQLADQAKTDIPLLENEVAHPELIPHLDLNHRIFLLAQAQEMSGNFTAAYDRYMQIITRTGDAARAADRKRSNDYKKKKAKEAKEGIPIDTSVSDEQRKKNDELEKQLAEAVSASSQLWTPLSKEGKAWLKAIKSAPARSGAASEKDVVELPRGGLAQSTVDVCRSLFRLARLSDKLELEEDATFHWLTAGSQFCAHQTESMYYLADYHYYYDRAADGKAKAWYWLTLSHRLGLKYGCDLDPKVCKFKIKHLLESKFTPMNMGAN